jgi:cell division protein FtsX
LAKLNEFGKYILSAGEIATYTVCPESWRLSKEEETTIIHTKGIDEGIRLHKEWKKTLDEANKFSRSIILLIILFILTVLFFAIRFSVR